MRSIFTSFLLMILGACGVSDFIFDQTGKLIDEEPRFVVARVHPNARLFYPRITRLDAYVVTRDLRGLKFKEMQNPLRNAAIERLEMSPNARWLAVRYDTETGRFDWVIEIHNIDTGRLELRHEFNTLSRDAATYCTSYDELQTVAPNWSDIIEDGRAAPGSIPRIRHYEPIDVLRFRHWTNENEVVIAANSMVGIVQVLPSGEERPWNAPRRKSFYFTLQKTGDPARWQVTTCDDRLLTTRHSTTPVHEVTTSRNRIRLDGTVLRGLDDRDLSGTFLFSVGTTDAWRPQ